MAEPEKKDNEHSVEGIDELLTGFMELEREGKDAFIARIMKDDLHEETKRTTVAEAIENTSGHVKQDILAEAVKAAPLTAKKAAVAEAVETSEGDEAKQEVLTEAVRSTSPIAKRAAIAEALWALPLQAKKELTVGALYGLTPRSKKHLARAVVAQLGHKDQYALAREFLLDECRAERERLLIISTFALVFAALTVGFLATVLWKPDSAQDMAAVFMGIAGALGGFVGGRATSGGVSG